MRGWLLIALVLAAGCATPAATNANAPRAPSADDAANATVQPFVPFPEIDLGYDGRTAEPAIAVAPDGTTYVAASPTLWRADDGRAFHALGRPACWLPTPAGCAPGYEATVAPLDGFGGGDVALGVDANGTVYFAGLQGKHGSVPFQRSTDRGETWSAPFDLAEGNRTDRQWMSVSPSSGIDVTWRDFGKDGNREQLLMRHSHDGGASWDPIRVIGPDALQGTIARDPVSGAIFTVVYDAGLKVARSDDDGRSWAIHAVTNDSRDTTLRAGRPLDMFPVVALDAAGTAYVAWSQDDGSAPLGSKDLATPSVFLSVSRDSGATWSAPQRVSGPGKVAAFPWLVAGAPGRVALTWYEGRAGTPSETAPDAWDVLLAESADASGATPAFVVKPINAQPAHVGGICRLGGGCSQGECPPVPTACLGQDRSHGEVFEMALRNGQPLVAWVADANAGQSGIDIHVGGVERGTALG